MFREALLFALNRQAGRMQALLADIPDDRLADPCGGGVNHPAWIMGHILLVEQEIIEVVLGGKAAWSMDTEMRDMYNLGSKPGSDLRRYKSKSFCLPLLQKSLATMCDLVVAIPESELLRANPHPVFCHYSPRKIDSLMAVPAHRAYHAGQIATWRKLQGMPHIGA